MGKTIVVVIDPDVPGIDAIRQGLGEAFEVHAAVNATQGLATARALKPAVLLVSYHLPEMNGLGLLGRIKADPSLKDIPVVFMMESWYVDDEADAMEFGAADCVFKPLNARSVSRRITNVISRETLRFELSRREADWLAILHAIPDLMFRVDSRGTYLGIFARDTELLFKPKRQLLGSRIKDVLPAPAAEIVMEAIADAAKDGSSNGHVIELDLPTGPRWFELSAAKGASQGDKEQTYIVLSRDITRRRLAEERIRHMARVDKLTELPNRAHFLELAEKSIAIAQRSGTCLALLYIDLDRFKPINDSYGHQMGDRVLHEVARRMKSSVRAADTVGRIGGDEFLIILTPAEREEDAVHAAEKVRHELERPMVFDDIPFHISCSIGVALLPQHGDSFDKLSQCADHAMYEAKKGGRNGVRVFSGLVNPT